MCIIKEQGRSQNNIHYCHKTSNCSFEYTNVGHTASERIDMGNVVWNLWRGREEGEGKKEKHN